MRIFQIIYRILNIKNYSLFLPKKSKIVILDFPGANIIKNSLRSAKIKKKLNVNQIPIVSTRNSKINLLIIILSVFESLNLKIGQKYIVTFIRYLEPKIIISHIDNNDFFFSLKNIFPNIKFIFIQNGLSLNHLSKEERKNLSWKADCFFCYSESYKKLYSEILKTDVKVIGSFKNNFLKKKALNSKNYLVFISQFNGYEVKRNIYKIEKLLLPLLYNFCVKKSLKLVIAGRISGDKSYLEKQFYKDLLPNKNFIFKNISNQFSSYHLIDNSKLTVFIDSALGYQSLARGNKTFACCIRSKYIRNYNFKFGWPKKIKNEGDFWINNFDEHKINLKINNIYEMQNFKWRKKYQKFIKKIIHCDKNNNKIFKKYIYKILNL